MRIIQISNEHGDFEVDLAKMQNELFTKFSETYPNSTLSDLQTFTIATNFMIEELICVSKTK